MKFFYLNVKYAICLSFVLGHIACSSQNATAPNEGDTSSGGPPADILFYSHCESNDASTSLDIVGDTGFAGGTAQGELPGLDGSAQINGGINSCQSSWTAVKVHHTGNGVQISLVSDGSIQLAFTGSFPTGTTSYQGTNMTCQGYSNNPSTSGSCPTGLTPIDTCSGLGSLVCVSSKF